MSSDTPERAKPLGLTLGEVQTELRRRGVKTPARQTLNRWDSAFTKLPTVHAGVAGRPSTRYAEDTPDRVEAILRLNRFNRRKLEPLRFELWWQGFRLDPTGIREYIAQDFEVRFQDFRKTRSGSDDPWAIAEELVQQVRGGPIRHAILRLAVQRVGRNFADFETAVGALIRFALGEEPYWEDDEADAGDRDRLSEREAVSRLMGFERAMTDEAPNGVRLMPEPVDVVALMHELRDLGLFNLLELPQIVRTVSSEELEQARLDARPFSEILPIVAEMMEVYNKRDFAGLGLFSVLARHANRYMRVIVLTGMIFMARAGRREGIDQINNALLRHRAKYEGYLDIIAAFPHYKKYYRHDHEKQRQTLSPEYVDKMTADIRQFLDENPRIREALND